MNRLKQIKFFKEEAVRLKLENCEIISKYNMQQLCSIYNGIGPDAFPKWLRDVITSLHQELALAAFIHDIEWHESDASYKNFTLSNTRFKKNGQKIAKAYFPWWHPKRYLVKYQAKKFASACQRFGYLAWKTPCNCAVCRKKSALANE